MKYSYTEDKNASAPFRKEYYDSFYVMLDERRKTCDEKRKEYFERVKRDPEWARGEFIKMLGWPLTEYCDTLPTVERIPVFSDSERTVEKLQLTMPIGIKFYGILMTHNGEGRRPLVITQHGGAGIPERLIGLFDGHTSNYNDIAERVFSRGVDVFLPGLFLWSEVYYEPRLDAEKTNNIVRRELDAKLKQVGSSITAVEVYCIKKCIDYLSGEPRVDTDRIGMIGLSYGGFYTLFTAAADTRIKAALASSQFNDRYEYSWPDWTWDKSAEKFLDAEVASLVYPRYLSLAVGDSDELFRADLARAEYDRMKGMTDTDGWLDFTVFSGNHEYVTTDAPIEKFIEKLNA